MLDYLQHHLLEAKEDLLAFTALGSADPGSVWGHRNTLSVSDRESVYGSLLVLHSRFFIESNIGYGFWPEEGYDHLRYLTTENPIPILALAAHNNVDLDIQWERFLPGELDLRLPTTNPTILRLKLELRVVDAVRDKLVRA